MSDQHIQDVLINLRRIIRATDLQSKWITKSCGLTIPQIVVLRSIDALGDVTVKKLSDHVSLSQATVTTILNRLEYKKLVTRVRSSADKRIVHARLTDESLQVLKETPPLMHEKFTKEFSQLQTWEQTQMLSSLQRIASMMDADTLDASPLLDVNAPTAQ